MAAQPQPINPIIRCSARERCEALPEQGKSRTWSAPSVPSASLKDSCEHIGSSAPSGRDNRAHTQAHSACRAVRRVKPTPPHLPQTPPPPAALAPPTPRLGLPAAIPGPPCPPRRRAAFPSRPWSPRRVLGGEAAARCGGLRRAAPGRPPARRLPG